MTYNIIKENFSTKKPVLLDGGVGTEVLRRGIRWRQHGIKDAPDVIRDIHIDYLEAGVDVLTTHTFNLTKRNFINPGCRSYGFNRCSRPAYKSDGIMQYRSVFGKRSINAYW